MLPKALEIALDTFANSFDLKSWQCYGEGEGVCLKIRFKPPSHVSSYNQVDTVKQQTTAKWKKVSPSQQKRDSERIERHRMKTRSQAEGSVEKPRKQSSDSQAPLDISTVTVSSDLTSVSDCSMVMRDSLNDSPSRSEFVLDNTEPCMSGHHKGHHTPVLPSVPTLMEEQEDEDSGSDSDIPPKCECPSSNCSYGCNYDDGDGTIPVFICPKCSNSKDGTMFICEVCLKHGGHSQHSKYIVPYNNT